MKTNYTNSHFIPPINKQQKKLKIQINNLQPEMIKQLYPEDKELLEKIKQIQENSQMSKTAYRSTSHICNATLKKISGDGKSQNESNKQKTNMSFRSNNNFFSSNSKILANNTKGFSDTNFSNFNQFNKTSYSKPKLEPLGERKVINDFNSEVSSNKHDKEEAKSSCGDLLNKDFDKNKNDNNENNDKENLIVKENKNNENLNNENVESNNNNKDTKSDYSNIIIDSKIIKSPVFHSTYKIAAVQNPLFTQSENINSAKANVNFHSTKNLFITAKKEKQLLGIKTEVNWKKPLGETQMPIIQVSLSTKNQNENNFSSSENNNVINYTKTNPNLIISNNNLNSNNNNNLNIKVNSNSNDFYNFNSVFDDKVKRKIIEKDIEKKVESFKIKLNSEMLKVLKEEKQKEGEREAFYSKAHTEIDRKRLENLIALERVQSSERIIRINE